MKKLVSVIIPTYSRPNYLIRAVESVLKQTYKNIELIVVDDNGEATPFQTETESLLSPYIKKNKLKYFKHKVNLNGSAARNTGIEASKGDFITFLDDDDYLHPDKLAKQVESLEKNKDYDVSYTGFRIILNGKVLKRVVPTGKGNMQYLLLTCRWGIGTGSNPMFTRKVINQTGLFDVSFIRHQDIEYLVRVFRNFKIIPVKEVLIDRFIDSRINSIKYNDFIIVKDKFLKTFKNDIDKYPITKKRIIYRNQYSDVACHAIQAKAYKVAFYYYKKAASYKMLSSKIIVKAILYGFFNFKIE